MAGVGWIDIITNGCSSLSHSRILKVTGPPPSFPHATTPPPPFPGYWAFMSNGTRHYYVVPPKMRAHSDIPPHQAPTHPPSHPHTHTRAILHIWPRGLLGMDMCHRHITPSSEAPPPPFPAIGSGKSDTLKTSRGGMRRTLRLPSLCSTPEPIRLSAPIALSLRGWGDCQPAWGRVARLPLGRL